MKDNNRDDFADGGEFQSHVIGALETQLKFNGQVIDKIEKGEKDVERVSGMLDAVNGRISELAGKVKELCDDIRQIALDIDHMGGYE